MRFPVLALTLGALGFLAFGVTVLAAPGLLAVIDVTAATATARSDVRAVYGGMELGVGVFLVLCARRAEWRRAGLAAQALAMGGVVTGRVVSLAVDGVPRPIALGFWAVELAGALLAIVALHAMRSERPR
ncbi:Protein of unknown function DUF4345 [Gemmatirosa kalamazoonensis]|uniref:DUF4345 domain-containing protein n=1 Tax=Gemmatirosa kalamazoonensis TaxID=861299 RepID=W0RDC6_9BACT|nr:DUF4345 domain-containing protein [Gemmatirosa kalamazoonensis]AHG89119.1 Protein of unknown function DUF4345 [Gemmatirosa kalamazoonensis]